MTDLRDLYQELILDHGKRPRNFRKMEHADRHVEGYNPLCGDHFHVYMNLQDDIVKEVSFEGTGCAISTASASLMTHILKGKSKQEAREIFASFHKLVTGCDEGVDDGKLGKLKVFAGVREYPLRVKCATLAWHTMKAAIDGSAETVTTES